MNGSGAPNSNLLLFLVLVLHVLLFNRSSLRAIATLGHFYALSLTPRFNGVHQSLAVPPNCFSSLHSGPDTRTKLPATNKKLLTTNHRLLTLHPSLLTFYVYVLHFTFHVSRIT